ncbi:MAG: hypothetical protein KDA69_07675 [Planctomycetaceae bacterium]|nr:hypothetical protein [Planctomycetaceae bacterium]
MSYVGKILVVIQVIMSVLFMAFAGAVFQMHQNWQSKHAATQKMLTDRDAELSAAQDELAKAKRDFAVELERKSKEAVDYQAQAKGFETQLGVMNERNNLLEQQRDTQTGLAESKADEAEYRQREAEQQRIENKKVQSRLDAASAENRDLKDQLFGKTTEYDQLVTRYNEMLEKSAFLEKIVRAYKLPTDPREVDRLESPPPPVEGLVKDRKMNKANRVQFVDVTIGSDDGILVGHVLDVVRPMESDPTATEWLGQIRIVSIEPDSAVGEVVLAAKNGIIREGDSVTTKL